jgi:hypothetical protein
MPHADAMTGIPLRIIGRPESGRLDRVFAGGYALTVHTLRAGDMWHEPDLDEDGRECWAIVLPNGRVWRTTDLGSDSPHPPWDVTGEPPAITVSPSINDESPRGGWHGFIRAGGLVPA